MPTYALQYPLTPGKEKSPEAIAQYEKETFSELTFRALTVEDYLGSDDHPGEHHVCLYYMSELSGKSPRVLKRMHPADWMGARKAVLEIVNPEKQID